MGFPNFYFLSLYLAFVLVLIIVFHIYTNYKQKKAVIRAILDPKNNPGNIFRIKQGPLVDFIHYLHKTHKTPLARLFVFDKLITVVGPFFINKFSETLTISLFFNPSKTIILIPRQWFEVFDEKDLKFVICHEIRHLCFWQYFSRIFYPFSRAKFFEKREADADRFAAKIVGKKQALQTLRKFKERYPDFELQKSILAIEEIEI